MTLLSLTGKRWALPEQDDRADGPVIDMLLRRRGIDALGAGEILESFGHDGRQFLDFEKAAERIRRAVAAGEKTGVFGDYDCDGITSTALLTRFLRRRGINPSVRLPHRLKEGYGLQNPIIDEFISAEVTLLLTVDTGVTAVPQIARARDAGIDVIVLDHHTLPKTLPDAFGILHPDIVTVPFDAAPCGAGVAWSLIHAMETADGNLDWDDRLTDVALAAIGTVADVVELRGGNRTLTHSGLLALAQLQAGPLALLCKNAGLESPYTSRDIGFRIAPRINAAGRMADPHIALYALLGDHSSLLELDALNRQRQDVVTVHIDDLLPRAEMESEGMLCFVSADYTSGICGLLAGRLTETFGRPSLVAAQTGEMCVASLRSIPGYDVTAGLTRCSDLLTGFGGHAMAAGCSFHINAFPMLRERLRADAMTYIETSDLRPTLVAECAIDITDVTTGLCDALGALEPFGQGNPEPRFVIEHVRLEKTRCVGKTGKHLQGAAGGRKLIGFNLGHLLPALDEPVDLLCRIGMDTWQGRRNVQLFLDDVRAAAFKPARVSLPS